MRDKDKDLWKAATKDVAPLPAKGMRRKGLAQDAKKSTTLRRGQIKIGARLDLHGLTQDEAHKALQEFLSTTKARGVLVITGASGVLREVVPLWLESKGLHGRIISFKQAPIEHGGNGALYIRLRAL